jgi:ribosomal protein S18 acetylase RimI-like enzyme
MRFPNDNLMNQAAVSARALVAAVFGGDELIGQRDRRIHSAPEFHTVSMVDMTVSPTTSTPENKCISVLYFSQVEGTRSLWIEWFGTDVDYRGRNLGIGTRLLQFVLDLAIIDEGVDDIYLEVGRDKEGKTENWKAARHVYEKVGFAFMENIRIPDEVVGYCKHFGDDYYNIMRFDCKGKATTRMSARRSTRRKIKK